MADEASDTFSGGWRNYLAALGFILPLVGVEEALRRAVIILVAGSVTPGTLVAPWWLSGGLILVGYPIYSLPAIGKRLRSRSTQAAPLQYFLHEDSELGAAILRMVHLSSWGKWFRAQQLANNKEVDFNGALLAASHLVADQLMNGAIDVMGRKPGSMGYEPIPRTYWRSTALHFVADSDFPVWRLILIPKGGVGLQSDKVIRADDAAAAQRTAVLQEYDSLIISSRQFEALWPWRIRAADKQRKGFLKKARKAGADPNAIAALSSRRSWRLWKW